MRVEVELLLTLTVYPLLLLMGWFFWNWRNRVTKLLRIEPLRNRGHVVFTVAGLRMAALFLWSGLEVFFSFYALAVFLSEPFEPFE
jgi:hypothetical protein